jgi:putative membrane protein
MSQPMFPKIALAITALSLGLTSNAFAQGKDATGPRDTPQAASRSGDGKAGRSGQGLEAKERKFVEEAARGGLAEVALGKLAQDKAQAQEVRQFGRRMVDDHSKANEELKHVAAAKGIDLPSELAPTHRREYERLQKLSGSQFDREYMKHMVSDHKKNISDFRSAAKSAKDADVKKFADDTLPTLEKHLELAKSAEAKVKGGPTNPGGGITGTTERLPASKQ